VATITAILTCFNRKEKTVKCLTSLVKGNPFIDFSFIVVDDNSNDGTVDAINELDLNTIILNGNGSLFWSGGMRKGIGYYLENCKTEYVMLVNDDVDFFNGAIEKILKQSISSNKSIVGATCNDKYEFTYGALKLIKPRKKDLYTYIKPEEGAIVCDTFNANCVLLKDEVIRKVGNFDSVYRHGLADLDYGFMVSSNGYKIISSREYVGVCYKNSIKGGWRDTSLSRIERIKMKESIKGSPFREWFYFLEKNFGYLLAIRYSITSYLRILIGK
jgi:GT2 family glycosyltransferase